MADLSNSIMIFKIGEQLFGYRTKHVSETINIDKIYKVPKTHAHTKGLINFRNSVVGIIDMGILLWNKPVQSDVAVVVEKEDAQVGMLIDSVKGVANIEDEQMREIEHISLEDINDEYLDGYFHYEEDEIVLMVNIDNIISKRLHKHADHERLSSNIEQSKRGDSMANQKGYILFQIIDEWYAIEVKSINEIITYPEHLNALPKAPHYVKGAFLLRGDSVILADLPEVLDIEDDSQRNRVILVNHGGRMIGVSIDNVRELKWISDDELRTINREDSIQKGMISLNGEDRVALLLDIEKIISNMAENIDSRDADKLNEVKEEKSVVQEKELNTYIQFSVGDIDMALPIKSVNEVVETSSIKSIPKAAEYLVGMMNLRNATLVIISLAKRLGIETSDKIEKLVVLDGKPIGLAVDELKGILHIDSSHISASEESLELEENFIEGIIREDNGNIIFILDKEVVIKHANVEDIVNKESIPKVEEEPKEVKKPRGRPPKKKVEETGGADEPLDDPQQQG